MKHILLIPHINVLNANALSSPYTVGFPAMSAWLGATHALERKLRAAEYDKVHFKSMAVVCHNIDLQTYKGNGDYVHSIIGTGNPLDKNGNRPSFIEEARCHLDISLVMECEGLGIIDEDDFTEWVDQLIQGKMKLAGGDILKNQASELIEVDDETSRRKLLRRLMPGYCLIERRDLMKKAMQEGQDAIDALLEYLKVTQSSELDENEKVTWTSSRREKGWIVPIATGFHGITDLGIAENQRDPDTPHRFAESIVTLGEFVMPYRIKDLDQMLWHYHTDLENNLYLCQQIKPTIEI
ncbi:MAG: type I-F CRISPR-associated protein Csy2 [Methylococcales bacterium]